MLKDHLPIELMIGHFNISIDQQQVEPLLHDHNLTT